MYVLLGNNKLSLAGRLTPTIKSAVLKSAVMVAPARWYSCAAKTRRWQGCTRMRKFFFLCNNSRTCCGVSGQRRSHGSYVSRIMPIVTILLLPPLVVVVGDGEEEEEEEDKYRLLLSFDMIIMTQRRRQAAALPLLDDDDVKRRPWRANMDMNVMVKNLFSLGRFALFLSVLRKKKMCVQLQIDSFFGWWGHVVLVTILVMMMDSSFRLSFDEGLSFFELWSLFFVLFLIIHCEDPFQPNLIFRVIHFVPFFFLRISASRTRKKERFNGRTDEFESGLTADRLIQNGCE